MTRWLLSAVLISSGCSLLLSESSGREDRDGGTADAATDAVDAVDSGINIDASAPHFVTTLELLQTAANESRLVPPGSAGRFLLVAVGTDDGGASAVPNVTVGNNNSPTPFVSVNTDPQRFVAIYPLPPAAVRVTVAIESTATVYWAAVSPVGFPPLSPARSFSTSGSVQCDAPSNLGTSDEALLGIVMTPTAAAALTPEDTTTEVSSGQGRAQNGITAMVMTELTGDPVSFSCTADDGIRAVALELKSGP